MSTHVLIVDDEPLIRQSLRGVLLQEGFDVGVAETGDEALRRFQDDRPDVVLLDLVLGQTDGLTLLRRWRQESPDTKIILISAHGSIESAVMAMKLGGYDFIKKPFELDEIVAAVRNAARTKTLEQRVAYFSERDRQKLGDGQAVWASPAVKHVVEEVKLYARSTVSTILVTGESGTGKQVIARLIHDESPRAAGPFVELNCSTIPENLVESELFGHERGAFSDARDRKLGLVEIADGGTLFLDEVGDLAQAAQAKLLTFIEQRTFRRVGATSLRSVDARVVAATNRDLGAMVAARQFRPDLWYRLNAITVVLPPLRARREDILPLARQFLAAAGVEYGRRWQAISPEAGTLLEAYAWPGNVRELRAVVSRAALLADDEILRPSHLPAALMGAAFAPPALPTAGAAASGAEIPTLEAVELQHIRRVLELCGGNRTAAAQHLGITRQTLSKRIGSGEEA
ncbi:MAG TPA: sigma-54 dependent transcriptional regulator [Polyangia bacterium]|nr:sigma-54 dependent transcriptional regulator [Polyangia bacterium]